MKALRGLATYAVATLEPEPSPQLLRHARQDLEEARAEGGEYRKDLWEKTLKDIKRRQ